MSLALICSSNSDRTILFCDLTVASAHHSVVLSPAPEYYYDDFAARADVGPATFTTMRDLGVLYTHDDSGGSLLSVSTELTVGPVHCGRIVAVGQGRATACLETGSIPAHILTRSAPPGNVSMVPRGRSTRSRAAFSQVTGGDPSSRGSCQRPWPT